MTWNIEHEFNVGDRVQHVYDTSISGYVSGVDASDIIHVGDRSLLKKDLKLDGDPTPKGWHNATEFERRQKLQEIGVPEMYIDHPWRDIVNKTQ